MKKIVVFLFIVMILVFPFIAGHGEVKQYEFQASVRYFTKNGLVGLMSDEGKVLLDAQFEYAEPFVNHTALVGIGEEYGIISDTGEIIIPIKWRAIERETEEGRLFVVADDEYKYGLYDDAGNELLSPIFHFLGDFHEERGIATSSEGCGIVDYQGKYVVQAQPDWEDIPNHGYKNGFAIVYDGNQTCFIDINGKVLGGEYFDDAQPFHDELAVVMRNGKYGFLDKNGNLRIQPIFDGAGSGGDGWYPVLEENQGWNFIDADGEFLVAEAFEDAGSFLRAWRLSNEMGCMALWIRKEQWRLIISGARCALLGERPHLFIRMKGIGKSTVPVNI